MPIRLVASDLDGTLFSPDHVPAPRTVAAVNALREAGILVAAVTGRSWMSGIDLVTSTGASLDWFIGANGGHRWDLRNDRRELEERLVFDAAEIRPLIDRIEDEIPGVGLIFEHAEGQWHNQTVFDLLPISLDGHPRQNTAEHRDDDIGKVMIIHDELDVPALTARIAPLVPDSIPVTSSGFAFSEITPNGADKGSALARLCAQLGVARSEVIAFGDNLNDLTMIEWAGRGVAMDNAVPELKAVADEVTASNADDGVAQVLETLLP